MRSILWAVLVTTACYGADRSAEAPRDEAGMGEQPEVLISTADALIGAISDLVVDDDGVVYAVDRQASQLHVVEGPGQVRSLGRPGAGPGEFSRPTTMLKRGDTLLVVDGGNGRLQGLSSSGAPLFTRPLPPGYPPSLGADGRFVRPTLGADTVLAVIHAPDLSVIAAIGQTVGVPANRVQIGRMKQQIQEGEVPEIFLNTAEAVVGGDAATWLLVPARGSVQRFDSVGNEVFSVTLDEPERETLFDRFVSENAAKPANSFAGLRYISDATVVGEDLWVLLGSSLVGTAAIRIIHPDGRVGDRIEFSGVSGAGQLAIDVERGFGYFVLEDRAELVRVRLDRMDTLPVR
jgi:hypothetical protein